MKSIHFHLLAFFVMSFCGCGNDDDICCINISTDVGIHYQTSSGDNLLGSSAAFVEVGSY